MQPCPLGIGQLNRDPASAATCPTPGPPATISHQYVTRWERQGAVRTGPESIYGHIGLPADQCPVGTGSIRRAELVFDVAFEHERAPDDARCLPDRLTGRLTAHMKGEIDAHLSM